MLLGFLTIVIMAATAYAYWREGLLTACTMCLNVFLAGLVAFNFWEPLADLLDPMFGAGNSSYHYEDSICLMVLFCSTLALLRWITNSLARTELEFPPAVLRGGGLLFGLATGYLMSGFLICVLQTLPWHENFMFFDPHYDANAPARFIRTVLPPDRLWLGLMQRAGAYPFSNETDPDFTDPPAVYDKYITFDKHSTFELRYARYRRYNDERNPPYPLPDQGDFDRQLHKLKKP